MATAKRLPSGSWRVRIFTHRTPDGKKHYKSFTAATKREAERMALDYEPPQKDHDLTVGEALDRYIKVKKGVLSASTVRGYTQMMNGKYFETLKDKPIYSIDSETLQVFISTISGEVGAKSVSNIYGFLSAVLAMFRPDAVFRVSLPKKIKPKKLSPSSAQVQKLFDAADREMKVCIALAAYGSLRRGEICGLKYKDIKNGVISVHAVMVENEDNKFVYKPIPKTSDSVRDVRVPDTILDLIGKGKPDDFIVKRTPNAVTHAFTRLRNNAGLDICLHDLRHFFASIGVVLGIPDNYLSDFGGWRRGSGVMREIYQNIIQEERDKYQNIMVEHFSEMTRSMTRKKADHNGPPILVYQEQPRL